MSALVDVLVAKVVLLEASLAFYANEDNYVTRTRPCDCGEDNCGGTAYLGTPVLLDRGADARSALGL